MMLNITANQANLTRSVKFDNSSTLFEKTKYCNLASDRSIATYAAMYDKPDRDYLVDGFGKKLRVTEAATRTPNGRRIEGMRAKFMDYFLYAMVQGEGIKASSI